MLHFILETTDTIRWKFTNDAAYTTSSAYHIQLLGYDLQFD
jgi:hypothetical protein